MTLIKSFIWMVAGLFVIIGFSACSGGSANSAAGETAINITFQKSSSKVLAAATLQELGISRLVLDVIPVNPGSVKRENINLFVSHQLSHTYSHTETSLTDNETYLFRITAYDVNGNFVYAGQSTQFLQPNVTNTVNLYAVSFTGFADVAGTWNFVWTDTGTRSDLLTVAANGTVTGVGAKGEQISGWLSPQGSGTFALFGISVPPATGPVTPGSFSGNLDAAAGKGSGTGTSPSSGSPMTWSSSATNVSALVQQGF